MKTIKKIGAIVLFSILTLIMLFNIYQYLCLNVFHQKLATINGYAILEVISGSMEPTIHIGDLIIIDTKEKNIEENDIITFLDVNGSFVTHRVISLTEDEMITKGDNNNAQDPVTKKENLVGKYLFKLTGVGIIFSSLKSPFVMTMILIIGILICVLLSTDKEGNVLLDEQEREYQEFLKYQKEKDFNKKNQQEEIPQKKKPSKKKITKTKK